LRASSAQPWTTNALVTRRCRRLIRIHEMTTTFSRRPSPAVMNRNSASLTLSGRPGPWCSTPPRERPPSSRAGIGSRSLGLDLIPRAALRIRTSIRTRSSWQPPASTSQHIAMFSTARFRLNIGLHELETGKLSESANLGQGSRPHKILTILLPVPPLSAVLKGAGFLNLKPRIPE